MQKERKGQIYVYFSLFPFAAHPRLSQGEGTRLIEHHPPQLAHPLEHRAALDQNATASRHAGTHLQTRSTEVRTLVSNQFKRKTTGRGTKRLKQ